MTDREIRESEVRRCVEVILDEHVSALMSQIIVETAVEDALENSKRSLDSKDMEYLENVKEQGVMNYDKFDYYNLSRILGKAAIRDGEWHKEVKLEQYREWIKDVVLSLTEEDITIYNKEDNRKRVAIHNYNKIVKSNNPSEMLFALLCKENNQTLLYYALSEMKNAELEDDNILIAVDKKLDRDVMWEVLRTVCESSYKEELGELTEEQHRLYEEHKKLDYKYSAFAQRSDITIDMIKKVDTWVRMFKDTDKINEVYESSIKIKQFIREMVSWYEYGGAITVAAGIIEGLKELYELEAHKLTDEAVRRYEVLK